MPRRCAFAILWPSGEQEHPLHSTSHSQHRIPTQTMEGLASSSIGYSIAEKTNRNVRIAPAGQFPHWVLPQFRICTIDRMPEPRNVTSDMLLKEDTVLVIQCINQFVWHDHRGVCPTYYVGVISQVGKRHSNGEWWWKIDARCDFQCPK